MYIFKNRYKQKKYNCMKKTIISLMILTLLPLSVSSALNPAPAYCERQGYTFEYVVADQSQLCIFDKDNQCDAFDFYNNECGSEYKRYIGCREEGKLFFSQFEECCDGLESSVGWWNQSFGLPLCVEKLNFFQKLWQWIS